MVCVYCKSDTLVINSRFQKRSNSVWRRRKCPKCQTIFSTNEKIIVELTWVVLLKDNKRVNFNQDKLFISILDSLKHRQHYLEDARHITNYVIGRLMESSSDANINSELIKNTVLVCLSRFDKAAYSHYKAFH